MAKEPSNDFGKNNPGNNAGSSANRPETGHNMPNSGAGSNTPQSGSIGSQNNDLNKMNDQFSNGQGMKHKPNPENNNQPQRNGGLGDTNAGGDGGHSGLGNAANNGGQNPNQNDDGIKDDNTQPKKSLMGKSNPDGKSGKDEPEDDKGLFDKMSDLGHNAPQNFKALGGKIKTGYANFSDKATDKTLMVGQKLNWSMRRKTATILVHALMVGGIGGGIIGLLYAGENNPLYSGSVCSTQNDNGDQYSGSDVNGGTGGLTDKGSAVYNLAKQVFIICKKFGMNAIQASGAVANMLNEGGGNAQLDEKEGNDGYGLDGAGLYQFTGGTKTQYFNWVKTNDAKKYGGGENVNPFGKNSVLLQTAGIMAIQKGNGVASDGIKPYLNDKSSNPRQAAHDFFINYENGSEGAWNADVTHNDRRQDDAVTSYKLFAAETASIGPDASIADGNSATAEQANDANCNQSSTPQSDSNIVNIATQLIGYFSYSQQMRTDLAKNGDFDGIKSVSDVKKDGHSDCSAFVWLVMKIAGKNVPATPFDTSAMLSDAQGAHKMFQEIPESQAKAGDVVITNGTSIDGHTGILAEDWHGNSTKIINEGQDGTNPPVVNKSYDWSFNSLLGDKPVFARIK